MSVSASQKTEKNIGHGVLLVSEAFSGHGLLTGGDRDVTAGTEIGSKSPLHNFGYQVGATSGLSESERREILTNFLGARSLIFDEQSSEEYRHHWGSPRSVQRLFRVASHIKWLTWHPKTCFLEFLKGWLLGSSLPENDA